jgi:hypothetical protein
MILVLYQLQISERSAAGQENRVKKKREIVFVGFRVVYSALKRRAILKLQSLHVFTNNTCS